MADRRGRRDLLHDLEAVAAVEGDVALLRRFEVAGQTLGVAVVQDRLHQRAADALALLVDRRPQSGQVPMGLVRVHRLDEVEQPQGGDEVRRHVGQHRDHGEDAAQPGEQRLAGRPPDGRARVSLGRVAAAEGEVVRLHLGAEVGAQPGLAARLLREHVHGDGVVPERARQLGRHRVDVVSGGTPDHWQGRFANHVGVDGGRGPGQAPPGERARVRLTECGQLRRQLQPDEDPARLREVHAVAAADVHRPDGRRVLALGDTAALRSKTYTRLPSAPVGGVVVATVRMVALSICTRDGSSSGQGPPVGADPLS